MREILLPILRAAFCALIAAGLVLGGWMWRGDGHGTAWLVCGLVLAATASALTGGVVFAFHTPRDRSGADTGPGRPSR